VSVLVDTSVWIRFLSNRGPYAAALDGLLGRDEVTGHDFVYGELLVGDVGGRRELLEHYERIDRAPLVTHAEVVEFVRDRRLHGRGIGWIDAHLLASALVGRLELWTADSALATVAAELGIAYDQAQSPDKSRS
jgi:predicted nucleic acid-binding protein